MPRLVSLTLLCLALIIQTAAAVWMQTSVPLSVVFIQTDNTVAHKNGAHAVCSDEEITQAPYLPSCNDNTSCNCIHVNSLLFPQAIPLLAKLVGKVELPIEQIASYHTRSTPHYRPPIG